MSLTLFGCLNKYLYLSYYSIHFIPINISTNPHDWDCLACALYTSPDVFAVIVSYIWYFVCFEFFQYILFGHTTHICDMNNNLFEFGNDIVQPTFFIRWCTLRTFECVWVRSDAMDVAIRFNFGLWQNLPNMSHTQFITTSRRLPCDRKCGAEQWTVWCCCDGRHKRNDVAKVRHIVS